ncbi:MAG TPA: guanylate kinase [Candidatus Limnocylindrales bacterium]|nr:guanylate kinase [Candidatus Limnocylindrales bacterium]
MKSRKPETRSQKTESRPPTSGSRPLLILISAPSGGGKTTLSQQLLAARPDLTRAITCTTRPPRPGEKDGVDYHFFKPAEFQEHVQAGDFIEHATVFGRSYGTLRSELLEPLRAGRDVLLNVDVQGAAAIREQAQAEPALKRALVTVFLTPPSVATLAERLNKRNTDAPEEIQKRLAYARQEIAEWRHFDYLLISSTISEDLRRMLAIFEAEKLRAERATAPEF